MLILSMTSLREAEKQHNTHTSFHSAQTTPSRANKELATPTLQRTRGGGPALIGVLELVPEHGWQQHLIVLAMSCAPSLGSAHTATYVKTVGATQADLNQCHAHYLSAWLVWTTMLVNVCV